MCRVKEGEGLEDFHHVIWYMAWHTALDINSVYSLCVCDACCVTYHMTKIFQAFSLLNSVHGSKVTYIKMIAGLHILREEGERRPGIEAI